MGRAGILTGQIDVMAHIIRRETKDYGGEEIWTAEDPGCPIYASPHITVTDKWLDGVIAQRKAGEDESKVDALYAEFAAKASAQVDKVMQEAKDSLSAVDYAAKTPSQVEADVKAIEDPWTDTLSVEGAK